MKMVRLSALRTGHLYLYRKYSWYSFLLDAESNPSAIVRSEGFYVNKKYDDSKAQDAHRQLVTLNNITIRHADTTPCLYNEINQ